MICVVLYFWNHLKIYVTMEKFTCFSLFFIIWSPFTHLDLMFRFTLGIILLGLLETLVIMILITICYLNVVMIVVNQHTI
jgi:hypothetical protein